MVTQIEVDLELHTLTLSRLTLVWTIPKRSEKQGRKTADWLKKIPLRACACAFR